MEWDTVKKFKQASKELKDACNNYNKKLSLIKDRFSKCSSSGIKYYALVPRGTKDLYAAGYDGNHFETIYEALDDIPKLKKIEGYDNAWSVVSVHNDMSIVIEIW